VGRREAGHIGARLHTQGPVAQRRGSEWSAGVVRVRAPLGWNARPHLRVDLDTSPWDVELRARCPDVIPSASRQNQIAGCYRRLLSHVTARHAQLVSRRVETDLPPRPNHVQVSGALETDVVLATLRLLAGGLRWAAGVLDEARGSDDLPGHADQGNDEFGSGVEVGHVFRLLDEATSEICVEVWSCFRPT
jgi:hypothetical protein